MLKLSTQFIKFCIVGSLNTVIDFVVYFGLTRLFSFWGRHLILATVVGFICSNIHSYFVNKRWTFENQRADHPVLMTKFFAVVGGSFIIYEALFAYMVGHLGWYDVSVKIGLILFAVTWNFGFSKLWVYTRK